MSRLEMLYKAVVLDHSSSPNNHGKLPNPTIEETIHNPTCGDTVLVQLFVEDGKIKDLRFDGQGCAISQASASVMTEVLKGQDLDHARELIEDYNRLITGHEPQFQDELGEALAFQGVANFPSRIRCAQLSWKATETGLDKLQDKEEE